MKKLILSLTILLSCSSYAQDTINFKNLNLSDSIVISKGNGVRKLALFEDPNCGYCKSFEAELAKINNVTLYIFLYPILGNDSAIKSNSIWCSANPVQSWQAWMINHVPPQPVSCSSSPIYRNVSLGSSLGMAGTPSIVFEDGTKKVGIMSAQDIENKFKTIYGGPSNPMVQAPRINQNTSTPSSGGLFK